MIWNTVKFGFRMSLVQLAAGVVSFISMFMIVSADIATKYKFLAGLAFIVFTVFLVWNNAVTWGENDAKAAKADTIQYYPLKGFAAGLLAMLLPLALTIYNLVINYYGWMHPQEGMANVIYLALFVIFLPYMPILSQFTSVTPIFNIEFCQPAIVWHNNINSNNAVMSYLFIIPILVFTAATGIFYLIGYHNQKKLVPKHVHTEEVVPKDENNVKET